MFQALKKRGGKREGAIFQLRYFHDVETKSGDFERIIDCSSELRSIFLDNPEEQTLDHIQHLHKLRLRQYINQTRMFVSVVSVD